MKLYELTNDLVELMEVEDFEGNEEIRQQVIEQIESMIDGKAENIIKIIKNYEADIEMLKQEEKRLANNRKIKENKVKRLKEYTRECLEKVGKKKIETSIGNISLRKSPASLRIIDDNLIPIDYKETIETVKIDNSRIKSDLKAGLKIKGAVLEEGNYSLQIK